MNKYRLIVYLLVVLNQFSVGSFLLCADLDCHAAFWGVSVYVCILCVFDLLSWPTLFLSKFFSSFFKFLFYQLYLFYLLQRINFGSNLSCRSPQGISLLCLCFFFFLVETIYLLFILFTYFGKWKSTIGPMSVLWYLCAAWPAVSINAGGQVDVCNPTTAFSAQEAFTWCQSVGLSMASSPVPASCVVEI